MTPKSPAVLLVAAILSSGSLGDAIAQDSTRRLECRVIQETKNGTHPFAILDLEAMQIDKAYVLMSVSCLAAVIDQDIRVQLGSKVENARRGYCEMLSPAPRAVTASGVICKM